MKKPEIILDGLQVKSLAKAQILAAALSTIEEECGIKESRITFRNMFVCPWIDLSELCRTEMEILVSGLLKKNLL